MYSLVRYILCALICAASISEAAAQRQPGWATAEDAFQAAFIDSGIGQRGYEENREYAAALYQMPDGRWYATAIVPGNRTRSSIPYDRVPAEAVRVAGAHTHGQPQIPEDPGHTYGADFSQTDRRGAARAFRLSAGRVDTQFLLTSRLKTLRMTLTAGYDAANSTIVVSSATTDLTDTGTHTTAPLAVAVPPTFAVAR